MTDEDASSENVARPTQALDQVGRPSQAVSPKDGHAEPALPCEPTNCQSCNLTKPPQYDFEQLAHGCATIQIVFEGREYCLRRTRAGKLVLNK